MYARLRTTFIYDLSGRLRTQRFTFRGAAMKAAKNMYKGAKAGIQGLSDVEILVHARPAARPARRRRRTGAAPRPRELGAFCACLRAQ